MIGQMCRALCACVRCCMSGRSNDRCTKNESPRAIQSRLDRTTFSVNYGVQLGFPKDVRIVIQVEAIKQ